MSKREEEYIGDGIYASFDGYYIWLRAAREGGSHVIALEPYVLKELKKYALKVWKDTAVETDL